MILLGLDKIKRLHEDGEIILDKIHLEKFLVYIQPQYIRQIFDKEGSERVLDSFQKRKLR